MPVGSPGLTQRTRYDPGPVELRWLAGNVSVLARARSSGGFALAFAERGRGVAAAVGIERPVAAGEICLSAGDLSLTGTALYGWLLTVDADWLAAGTAKRLVGPPEPAVRLLAPQERSRCAVFFRALDDELARGRADRPALRALVELLVVGYSRAAVTLPDGGALARTSAERLAAEVLEVIDSRFAERLSLAEVAARLARAPASVARAAREVTGRSVLELIVERRMQEARRLLAASEMSIGEIAGQVGYPSVGYFHRVFRRVTGMTPQRWRSGAMEPSGWAERRSPAPAPAHQRSHDRTPACADRALSDGDIAAYLAALRVLVAGRGPL